MASTSPVHQILLSHGAIDRTPTARISDLKRKIHGNHTLWLEEDIVNLLRDRYSPRVLAAYQSLKPLAYKADLARYCILHTFGGWYVDLFVTVKNLSFLDNFPSSVEALLFREMMVPPGGSLLSIVNTVFWFKSPQHEVLGNLIETVTTNVLEKKYGVHPFSLTGSMAFGKEVALYELKNSYMPFLIGECSMVNGSPTHQISSVLGKNPFVVSTRRKIEEDISLEVPSGYETHPNNYYRMWFNQDIFN